jgi:hypothetical protein
MASADVMAITKWSISAPEKSPTREVMSFQHYLDVHCGDGLARLDRASLAEITLGIKQHRGRDKRRHLLDAKLLQRRVSGRFDVGLFAKAKPHQGARPRNLN